METIGSKQVYSILENGSSPAAVSNTQIRKSLGYEVNSYLELAAAVAQLQFLNPEFMFLFRGQSADYKNREKNTTLKPGIFRGKGIHPPSDSEINIRYKTLNLAERELVKLFSGSRFQADVLLNERKKQSLRAVKTRRLVRWSILQHYEICQTPLLDVTHSLRIAASFADPQNGDDAFLFVIGVPNLSGAVTASADSGIQAIRLSSICPPQATRPHIQEGYLLGEFPDIDTPEQITHFRPHEIDFGRRLIAKFRFDPHRFWSQREFPKVDRRALYPDQQDPMFMALQALKYVLMETSE